MEFYLRTQSSEKGCFDEAVPYLGFKEFYSKVHYYLQKKYCIHDEARFKSLMQTFFIISNTERAKMN
jgi:hypothetical protein